MAAEQPPDPWQQWNDEQQANGDAANGHYDGEEADGNGDAAEADLADGAVREQNEWNRWREWNHQDDGWNHGRERENYAENNRDRDWWYGDGWQRRLRQPRQGRLQHERRRREVEYVEALGRYRGGGTSSRS